MSNKENTKSISIRGRNSTKSELSDQIIELEQRLEVTVLARRAAEREAARERRRRQNQEDLWKEVAGHFKGFNRLKRVPSVRKDTLRSPAGHVTVFTDWHIGSLVRPESMAGAIEYNSDIAYRALHDIIERMITDVEHERRTRPVDDTLIVSLGDLIDGEIHPDNNWSRDLTPPESAALAGEMLGEVIDLYARHFKTVTALLVGGSNHERTTAKPVFERGAELSLGYLIRKIAESAVKHHPNVRVISPTDLEPVIEWRGKHWGALHGHQIPIRNRTPIPGMEDYYDGFQTQRVSLGLPPVEMLMMGHVHQHTVCRGGRRVSFPPLCGSSQRTKSLYKVIDHGAQMSFLHGREGPFAFTQYARRSQPGGDDGCKET